MKSSANVLECTNHILVLEKPAGVLTQPNRSADPSLEELGKEWVREHFHKPGNVFLEAVHRIDRSASGVVLFARTSKALARLMQAVRERRMRKMYRVLVEGEFDHDEGEMVDLLTHEEYRARVDPQGREARLKYRVLNRQDGYTFLDVDLETGRYHQIRAQFSARGHPIVGDHKYGSRKAPYAPGAIALHHAELSFPDPITGETLTCSAPCPFAQRDSR